MDVFFPRDNPIAGRGSSNMSREKDGCFHSTDHCSTVPCWLNRHFDFNRANSGGYGWRLLAV
jgi:hypothetical protein